MRSGSDDYVPGGDVAIRLIPDLLSRGTATVFMGNLPDPVGEYRVGGVRYY